MKTVRFAIRVSDPPRPRSTQTRATPLRLVAACFPLAHPRRKRKVRPGARRTRATPTSPRRPSPPPPPPPFRCLPPPPRRRRLRPTRRRRAPRRRGASRRLGLDADGAHHRARVSASVLVRVIGEESHHASRAHRPSPTTATRFAPRPRSAAMTGGDARPRRGRGDVPRPTRQSRGSSRARRGRARRTTCHRGGGPGRRRVRRLPRAFARSGERRGAPARRVGGNHDRLLSLGVADEVGADDPALRNAGVTCGGSGGKVRRGKDETRAATVGDDGGGTKGRAPGMRRRRRDGGEKGAAAGDRSLAREWGGRTCPHLLVDREADLATHVLLLEDSSSDIASSEPFVRRAAGCGHPQRVPCRGKPDVEPPAPAPYRPSSRTLV